jgi:aryl-alcohol dehydrogenase-like predicted oxidoreductase
MAAEISAARSGEFKLDGALAINRLGFGAMRITGRGIWGPPRDKGEALRVLRALANLDVNFIDTAWSYGPKISEQLIREALYPYDGFVIATKGGLTRPGPDRWEQDGRPERLIADAKDSLKRLGLEQIPLWQLHRIDAKVPAGEQFDAVASLLEQGLIAHAGLSEVSVEDIKAASKVFRVASVQNRYSSHDRASEGVLKYCEANGIGFIPWYPLGGGALAQKGSPLAAIAQRVNASPAQVALAWTLKKSPVMLPIPGTSKVAHLEENVAAANIDLSSADFEALENAA